MMRLWTDLRQSLRLFRTSPGFAAAIIAAIALGIGTNTAIFSVVNAVVLKPLPFQEPDRIVQLQIEQQGMALGSNTSPAKFMHWRELDDVFNPSSNWRAQSTSEAGSSSRDLIPMNSRN